MFTQSHWCVYIRLPILSEAFSCRGFETRTRWMNSLALFSLLGFAKPFHPLYETKPLRSSNPHT